MVQITAIAALIIVDKRAARKQLKAQLKAAGSVAELARKLGVSRPSVYSYLRQVGVKP